MSALIITRHMLQAHGISYDDIDVRYLSFNESASALRDGAIDAAVMSVGSPAAAVLEATTTAGVRLLPVDPELVRTMQEEHPYYTTTLLPVGAYPGVEVAIPTLAVQNWIVGMDSLDDEVVTRLLNILTEDRVSLEQVHDMAKQIDMDRLADAPIALHSATRSWLSER